MQQAGPSYIAVATKMHFQRTAGLEQEIENLKNKLAACTREKLNFQEELSEAYRIKSQLADLHSAEVAKNMEAEKQVKFFQGCVAAAFSERDNSIMEVMMVTISIFLAEEAKEKEEIMSQKLIFVQKRVEELTSDCLELKKLNDQLRIELAKQDERNETFNLVISKFYEIKQHSSPGFEGTSWDDKCGCLLDDPDEMWSFNDTSTSEYISALEEELQMVRNSVDNLQNRLRVGLDIENHYKKRIIELEKKQILTDKVIKNGIAELKYYHSQHKTHILNFLEEGESSIKSISNLIDERIRKFDVSITSYLGPHRDSDLQEYECRNVDTSAHAKPYTVYKGKDPSLLDGGNDQKDDASKALAQALQEKVAALMLLSQQEERELLGTNVNSALQRKVEELQRNLQQVTNEKVTALMELAQLKLEHHLLLKNLGQENKQVNFAGIGESKLTTHERDGRFRNLMKKTYLRRWIGPVGVSGNEADVDPNIEGKLFTQRSNGMDFARMKIENATLKESVECLERLTSSVHKLRLSLLQAAKESAVCKDTNAGISEILGDIVGEVKLLKTALCSSLPISWSAEADIDSISEKVGNELGDVNQGSSNEKIDFVSAAGFEMVELLLFAVQILKDNKNQGGS
ncbi:Myosin heavy chain-like protein [Quillaja saponaria]|uniref:Myosin heavy chain-like protein n=1 Tax=Quillaja saponaria TaxID=32244 RepID=A0AAD7KUU5_QUISA|nr:Myosin heavy chain-like protein [Quillaja saponaria]